MSTVRIHTLYVCAQVVAGEPRHAGVFCHIGVSMKAGGWVQVARHVGASIEDALARCVAGLARRFAEPDVAAVVAVLPTALRDLVAGLASSATALGLEATSLGLAPATVPEPGEAPRPAAHTAPCACGSDEFVPVPSTLEATFGGETRALRVARTGPRTAQSIEEVVVVEVPDGSRRLTGATFTARPDRAPGAWRWTADRIVFRAQFGFPVVGWADQTSLEG